MVRYHLADDFDFCAADSELNDIRKRRLFFTHVQHAHDVGDADLRLVIDDFFRIFLNRRFRHRGHGFRNRLIRHFLDRRNLISRPYLCKRSCDFLSGTVPALKIILQGNRSSRNGRIGVRRVKTGSPGRKDHG